MLAHDIALRAAAAAAAERSPAAARTPAIRGFRVYESEFYIKTKLKPFWQGGSLHEFFNITCQEHAEQ